MFALFGLLGMAVIGMVMSPLMSLSETEIDPPEPDEDPADVLAGKLRPKAMPDDRETPPQEGDIILGSSDHDRLSGTELGDFIDGDDGNDHLSGGGGGDFLHGGRGDDIILGEDGDDRLYGHTGDDRLDGGSGDDWLNGGDGDDLIYGGEGDDTLSGGLGDDRLYGGAGRDVLHGGQGNDLLDGQGDDAVDFLNGGAGDDILIAGRGDHLHGGTGRDLFDIAETVPLSGPLSGHDLGPVTIADFDPDADRLVLRHADPPAARLSLDPRDGALDLRLDGIVVATFPDTAPFDLSLIQVLRPDATPAP